MKALQEIFQFYVKQHQDHNGEFDDMKETMEQIDLGGFIVFCKDFNIV